MGKRFTDTEKWRDEWWGSLGNDYRMIWLYLIDSCSIAGIWKKDFRGLNFNCNTSVTEDDFLKVFGTRIIDKGSYYFIPKFIRFQCPNGLKSKKPAVLSIVKELQLHNLIQTVIELFGNDYLIIKGKGKGKDKGKEEEREKEKTKEPDEPEILKNWELPDIDGDELVFPLDTIPVRELWANWKKYRWEKYKLNYGMMGEQADLKRLEGLNFHQIQETILAAISGQWKNLYPDKSQGNGKTGTNKKQQHTANLAQSIAEHYAPKLAGSKGNPDSERPDGK